MLIDFSQILSRFLDSRFVRNRKTKRLDRTRDRATLETLEPRTMLTSPLVADVLSGNAGTSVFGAVYADLNSDGVKNNGEDGISGWTVYLDLDNSGTLNNDAAGTQEPSAVTNVDGDYQINHLIPGVYRVSEVVQSRWTPTAPASQDVTVELDRDTRIDFFNFSGGDVVGTVWNDLNGDGERAIDLGTGDFTEPGLANWTVFLDLNSNTFVDPDEPTTLTDENGMYAFINIPPDEYEVTAVLPDGWDEAPGFDRRQSVFVVAQQQSTQDYAAFTLLNGSIEGTVWNDLSGDGDRAFDLGTGEFTEPGLADWTVFLDLNEDGIAQPDEPTTLTDSDGVYSFISILAGHYEVTEVLPDGWYTATGFGINQRVEVFAGEKSTAEDFANFTVQNGSIRGTVWNDLNRDGIRNVNLSGAFTDPGLEGFQVYLDLNRNSLADVGEPSVLTDVDGAYFFPDLQVGEYEIREFLPSGWETTTTYDDNQSIIVYSGAESVARDFANFNLSTAIAGSVSGTVWNDLNGNGVRDVTPGTGVFTDPGLPNWVVYVDLNSNRVFDPTEPNATSALDGSYTISGVTPGTVSVIEVAQAGWHATSPIGGLRTISLRNAGNATGLDFGNYTLQEAGIQGTVFADTNKNGVRDAGERGLDGITVYLDSNDNGVLDPTEPTLNTSEDLFYTPAVDEAGFYSFTHLAVGTYTVRTIVPATLSATPVGELTHTVTLAATELRTGVNTAAVFRPNEIHGTKFDDSNGNHQRDAGEDGVGGVTIYIDLDRDEVPDADEPRTVTGADGAYSFDDLTPGAYVVREVLESGYETTYPTTTGGTLWPAGTSNPAVGIVSPTSITTSLAAGAIHLETVSITLPNTGALTNLVDVFLLFDDTGSFVNNSPIVRAAFPAIIAQLQAALPGIDLGFGVGRFEEYGNFAYEYSTGRPFVLNQPIVAASTAGYLTAIQAALNRTTPGYGGDGPETDIEALYQLVTGVGFDGNNNGSVLDSGAAGLASTQINPGNSGDVPSFASFQADAANSVLPAAGTVGGGGFRPGALPIFLTATDIGFAYQPRGETTITGVGGVTLPVSELTQTSRPTTPFDAGAGLQQTVTALNALGALVIGLGTNPDANVDPRQGLEALSTLTGAVNRTTTTIANGTADPIAPGDPLYFQISSGFASSVANGVASAIQNAVTNVAVDITVQASDPRVRIINHSGTRTGIGSGQTATFDIEFIGDGVPHRFDLQFVRAGTNVVLGSIPVVIGTPIPGSGYEFEDLEEGEIEIDEDFGSHLSTTGDNLSPTDLTLSSSFVAENQPAGTAVGTFTTTDPDAGDTFTYALVSGANSADNARFQIVGNELRTNAVLDFESQVSYQVRVSTTDAGGLVFEKAFAITATNVNEEPVGLILSTNTAAENQPVGTAVGTFTTTDPDSGDTFTYALVSGADSADNASFQIVGNELQTNAVFDFESQAIYQVRVSTTDAGGLVFEKAFTITATNVNEGPTVLILSEDSVAENQPVGAPVGTFTTTDPDLGDAFNYLLVPGVDSTDNGLFQIVGNVLQTNAVLDFDAQSSYSIRVRTTDIGGLSFERVFTITATNVNEAPVASNGTLSTTQGIAKNGILVATDVDNLPAELTISVLTGPSHGSVVITDVHTGAYTYTPAAGYNGPDSFTFKANDGSLNSNTATVSVTVAAFVPPPPIIIDNAASSGYSETGSWKNKAAQGSQGYLGNLRYAKPVATVYSGYAYDNGVRIGSPGQVEFATADIDTASFTFTNLSAGTYQIAVTYAAGSNRASNASFTVAGTGATNQVVTVNQKAIPNSFTAANTPWQTLVASFGSISDNGTITVTLTSAGANGYVIADAVRIQQVSPMLLADGPAANPVNESLSTTDLQKAAKEAVSRWKATDLTASQLAALKSVQFQVQDLPGIELGVQAANVIYVDQNAAGHGWFVDKSLKNDREFHSTASSTELRANSGSPAFGKLDLLSVVMHELGHVIGVAHSADPTSLMAQQIGVGIRRLPQSAGEARAKVSKEAMVPVSRTAADHASGANTPAIAVVPASQAESINPAPRLDPGSFRSPQSRRAAKHSMIDGGDAVLAGLDELFSSNVAGLFNADVT